MKHVTFADKSLLVGDEAADLLLRYAAALSNLGRADTVHVNAVNADGNDVVATFLLTVGSPLMTESTNSMLEEPGNTDAIEYMTAKLEQIDSILGTTDVTEALDYLDIQDDTV